MLQWTKNWIKKKKEKSENVRDFQRSVPAPSVWLIPHMLREILRSESVCRNFPQLQQPVAALPRPTSLPERAVRAQSDKGSAVRTPDAFKDWWDAPTSELPPLSSCGSGENNGRNSRKSNVNTYWQNLMSIEILYLQLFISLKIIIKKKYTSAIWREGDFIAALS